ncbi:MAG: phage tail protein [Ruminococcus sp.]|nr:phage tail protein [Candidatus Copronaster equi]
MADFTQDLSIESTYTHVFPYFKTETGIVTLVSSDNPSGLISLSNPNNYTERALILELNVEGEEQPTKSTLQTKANAYIAQNSLNTPSISIKVSMVNLSDSPEFREYAELERCSLCDTVTVIHQPLKIKTKAKIIETVYDSIAERYISMTIGESTSTLSDSFQKTNNEIKKIANLYQKNTNTIQTMINNAVDASTKAITGNSGGHIRTYPEINPQELCVMDTDSIATARKIWRFNLSGFGYSSTGYNGTYRTAITMDGAINADFITTGTLTANIIRAGILSSATGNTYFNLDNGLLHTNNAEIEGGKISLGGYYGSDAIKTVIEQGHIDLYYNNSFSARLGQSETKGFTIEHTVGYPTFSFEWQNWGISGQFTEALRAVIHTRGGAVIDVGNGQNGLIINSSNTLINSPITAYGKITASGDMESGGLIKCHEFLTNNGAYSYIGTGGSYKLYYNSDWHIFSQIYSSRLALGIDAIPMDLYATSQIKCHATLVNSNGTAFKTNAAVHETITDANELVIPPDFMTYFENSDITISPPQIIATEAYQETQVIENPDGTISEEIIEHPATERREEKKVSFTDAEDAPDIIKLDDGIDIFSMAALMWKVIQNLNERLKALEYQ